MESFNAVLSQLVRKPKTCFIFPSSSLGRTENKEFVFVTWTRAPEICTMTPERPPPLWSLLPGWSRGHSYPNPGVQRCAPLRRDLHTCWLPKAEKWQGGLWLYHHLPTVLQLWGFRSFAMLNFFNRLNKMPFKTDWKRKKSPLEKTKEMMQSKGNFFLSSCLSGEKRSLTWRKQHGLCAGAEGRRVWEQSRGPHAQDLCSWVSRRHLKPDITFPHISTQRV